MSRRSPPRRRIQIPRADPRTASPRARPSTAAQGQQPHPGQRPPRASTELACRPHAAPGHGGRPAARARRAQAGRAPGRWAASSRATRPDVRRAGRASIGRACPSDSCPHGKGEVPAPPPRAERRCGRAPTPGGGRTTGTHRARSPGRGTRSGGWRGERARARRHSTCQRQKPRATGPATRAEDLGAPGTDDRSWSGVEITLRIGPLDPDGQLLRNLCARWQRRGVGSASSSRGSHADRARDRRARRPRRRARARRGAPFLGVHRGGGRRAPRGARRRRVGAGARGHPGPERRRGTLHPHLGAREGGTSREPRPRVRRPRHDAGGDPAPRGVGRRRDPHAAGGGPPGPPSPRARAARPCVLRRRPPRFVAPGDPHRGDRRMARRPRARRRGRVVRPPGALPRVAAGPRSVRRGARRGRARDAVEPRRHPPLPPRPGATGPDRRRLLARGGREAAARRLLPRARPRAPARLARSRRLVLHAHAHAAVHGGGCRGPAERPHGSRSREASVRG